MSIPPKSDDESAASEKKTVRRRPRTTKPKAAKSASTAAEAPAKTEAPAKSQAPENTFVPSRAEAPAPVPEAPPISRKPWPDPVTPPSVNPQVPERTGPASVAPFVPVVPVTDASSNAPSEGGSGPSQGDGGAQPQNGEGNQYGAGGGQQGGYQERGFWKRNKRGKRGRHGGGWQPGPGGGGGGGGGGFPPREQHPPQPPPPSNTPVFGDLPNPSRFTDLTALDTLAAEVSAGSGETVWLNDLYALHLADLTAYARKLGVSFDGAPGRRQLLTQILAAIGTAKTPLRDRGYIDVTDRGAFVVHTHVNYRLYPEDPYLPESLIQRYGLKRGHQIEVLLQAPQPGERCPSVVRIESVMGGKPEAIASVMPFEELIPYYPLQRILLESEVTQKDVSMRAVDILTPIGFGQRALIVAPPRTGKTVLLQNMANSITENSPHAKLILLLIDERPEEVTDFRRHTKGEVVSSTFDESPESHVHCAEMVIEKARRLVEQREHVVILLDSITRLARAYNALTGNQGKTMSGGLESNALQKPKRFFGSARNIEGGGSLTIIASALIDTGSRMDEIIFEEFKGTGNCELHLDRGLVERRIFPAINIDRSGTRKEELIYHPDELQRIYGLRRAMQGLGPIESMEMLITRLKKTKSNAEFLVSLRGPHAAG